MESPRRRRQYVENLKDDQFEHGAAKGERYREQRGDAGGNKCRRHTVHLLIQSSVSL